MDGRFPTSLSRALEAPKARADGVSDRPDTRGDTAETGRSTLRLGRMAVTGTSALHFRDDVITPKVKLDSVFKEFQLRNLDTGDADQRADFSVTATVDGRTDVMLTGWVSGSMENADLDVTAKVENLHLPACSPVEKSAGVLLASGRLDGTAKIKGTKGNLAGEMRVAVADAGVPFRERSRCERIRDCRHTAGDSGRLPQGYRREYGTQPAHHRSGERTRRGHGPGSQQGGRQCPCDRLPANPDRLDAGEPGGRKRFRLYPSSSPRDPPSSRRRERSANSLAKLLSEHPDLSITLRPCFSAGQQCSSLGRSSLLDSRQTQWARSVTQAFRPCLIRQEQTGA